MYATKSYPEARDRRYDRSRMKQGMFTIPDAMALLGLSRKAIEKAVLDGELVGVRLGYRVGFLKADLERYALEHLKQDEVIE